MSNTTTATRTEIPCPSWCTVDHSRDLAGCGFHASDNRGPSDSPVPFRLWQADRVGAEAGVVLAGSTFDMEQVYEMSLALMQFAGLLQAEARNGVQV